MFKNKKEHFIFVLMIAATMVFIMTCYNVALVEGFSSNTFKHVILGFPLAYIYALIGDIFIVGKIVKSITSKILKPEDSMKKVGLLMSAFTTCGMVLWMSLFGVIVNIGFDSNFISNYCMTIATNFVFALPLNLLIVSPSIRSIFFKMFPPIIDGNNNNNIENINEEINPI